ncbi:MAG TPA: hypothetical protein VJY34_03100 [Roseiarcus sp.]|nr:hypothetical protein [Roseiarcus sp.]
MTRIARIVAPGLPHHVTQRGNRAEKIFFEPEDYRLYKDWLAQSCRPLGGAEFQDAIGRRLNRLVTPRKRGRKPKGDVARVEANG